MTEWLKIDEDGEINIEEIMRQIRAHIADVHGQDTETEIAMYGVSLPSTEVLTLLKEARHHQQGVVVSLSLRRSRVPLVGPLLDKLRRAAHELVVFYVNMSASRQSAATAQVIEAISVLAQQVDDATVSGKGCDALRSEVAHLRQQLTELRAE